MNRFQTHSFKPKVRYDDFIDFVELITIIRLVDYSEVVVNVTGSVGIGIDIVVIVRRWIGFPSFTREVEYLVYCQVKLLFTCSGNL